MSWDTRSYAPTRPSVWTVVRYVIGTLWILAAFAALVSIPVAIIIALFIGARALLTAAGWL
ncbi:MAG: hypothetical protein ACYC6C_10320 [Coriobacteriia bacterium]